LSQTCLPMRITNVWNAVTNISSQAHHKRLKRCHKHICTSASKTFETLSQTHLHKRIKNVWNAVTNTSAQAHHKRLKRCHKHIFTSASQTFETLSQTQLHKRITYILKCCHKREFASVANVCSIVKSRCPYVAQTPKKTKNVLKWQE
jgi:truncated hemoglobin YjbI